MESKLGGYSLKNEADEFGDKTYSPPHKVMLPWFSMLYVIFDIVIIELLIFVIFREIVILLNMSLRSVI